LSKEGNHAGTEAEGDDEVRRNIWVVISPESKKHGCYPEQAQGNNKEARDRSTAQGNLNGLIQAGVRGSGAAYIRFDRNPHAYDARKTGAEGADEESNSRPPTQAKSSYVERSQFLFAAQLSQYDADYGSHYQSNNSDGGILASDESPGAFRYSGIDILHRWRPWIAAQDLPNQAQCEHNPDSDADRYYPENTR
jgi:hypothetical protein